MRIRAATTLLVLSTTACGGKSSADIECTAGEIVACTGVGGCTGTQVCAGDGTGYDACRCDIPDTGGGVTDSTTGGEADVTVVETAADSPSEAVSDTPVAPISPNELAGLALWLDGDKGVTTTAAGLVESWADQSGSANNAHNCNFVTQSKSELKGHDVLNFRTGSCQIDDDPGLQFGTSAFALMAVVRTNVDAGMRPNPLFEKYGPSSPNGVIFSVDTNAVVRIGEYPPAAPLALAQSALSVGSYHLLIARGPDLEMRVDGVTTKGTSSTVDISGAGGFVLLGRGSAGGGSADPTSMSVAEVVAVKGAVSDSQLLGVEAYFKARYKFAW